ncbi:hypothetical protein [Streptomyces sp. NPDC001851]|uniref:hypothetical protein n=1 Tax=Streptomyces sp. NPDC001851 TaxID=3154529 RepID=UPI00332710E6
MDLATLKAQGQVAPLGNGWPGFVRYDGSAEVVVALGCQNNKDRALVAYGDLLQWPEDINPVAIAPAMSPSGCTGVG